VSETPSRGDVIYGRVVQAVMLGLFSLGFIRGGGPGFAVMFLALVGAVFPLKEFRAILRSWRNGKNGDST
jgi:hypothetical protein